MIDNRKIERKFNEYCADIMGLIVVPSEYSDEHIFVKNPGSYLEWYYHPYDDLNQMAEVVTEITMLNKYESNFKELVRNMVLDIPLDLKQILREFIESTDNNKLKGE